MLPSMERRSKDAKLVRPSASSTRTPVAVAWSVNGLNVSPSMVTPRPSFSRASSTISFRANGGTTRNPTAA